METMEQNHVQDSQTQTQGRATNPRDLLERTRDQIKSWSSARIDDLQDRKAELLRQRDEATRAGRETLLQLEATALEGARDLLLKAESLVGPNARFLARGRAALDDAIVTVRSAHAGGLPIDDFDCLSIPKITPHLSELSGSQLKTLRAYEAANKNRKTLLRELDARLTAFTTAQA
jgi:hypothetical protein